MGSSPHQSRYLSPTLRDTPQFSFVFKCRVFLVVNSYLPEYSLCSSHTLELALKNRSVRMASTPPPMYRFYSTATKAVLLQLKQFLTKIQYLICVFLHNWIKSLQNKIVYIFSAILVKQITNPQLLKNFTVMDSNLIIVFHNWLDRLFLVDFLKKHAVIPGLKDWE